jgi:hypothetical protein
VTETDNDGSFWLFVPKLLGSEVSIWKLDCSSPTTSTNHNRPHTTPTMNKTISSLAAVLAMASFANAGTSAPATSGKACQMCTAPAADESLGLGLGVSYDSHYIFRGLLFGESYISGGLDYSLSLTETIRLDLDARYGILAGDDDFSGGLLDYERLELGAGLVTDLGPVELGLGYRYYQHNNDLSALLNDSHEVGLSLATEVSGVTLGLAGYYDITNEGFYFEAKAAYEIKITESFSLVPAIGVGYAVDYNWQTIAPGLDGFTAVTASLSAPVKLAKNVTLTPYIAGNLPVDALDDAGEDSQLFGGVSLSVRF